MTIKAILFSLLVAGVARTSNAQITSGQAVTLATGTSCPDAIAACSFDGDCCSLSDNADNGGCTLTIIGGTCTPSGEGCPWSLSGTSTSSDACPESEYDISPSGGGDDGDDGGDDGDDGGDSAATVGVLLGAFAGFAGLAL